MPPILRRAGLLVAALLPAAAVPATALPPPRLVYESPAGPARDPGDPPPISWGDSNRTVGALGGHAGHLRVPAKAPR